MLCVPAPPSALLTEPAPTPPAPPAGPAPSRWGKGFRHSRSVFLLVRGGEDGMGTSSAFNRSSHPRADQASLQWDLPWDRHGKLPGLFPELAVTRRPRGNALCWVVTCCEEGAVLRSQHLTSGRGLRWDPALWCRDGGVIVHVS